MWEETYKQGSLYARDTFQYNVQGQLIQASHRYRDNTIRYTSYEYDAEGHLILQETYDVRDSERFPQWRKRWEYELW